MDVRLRPRRKASHVEIEESHAVLPNVCPECGGAGYLDSINLVREMKVQSCFACELRWESPIE
ncbi:MAG TPA: hypothetical protein VGZ52_00410 [Acidimicrobiales bacterium]|jgi:hypothetical protein|nr:hypothetical protein [Acidimicrobiales bacterium]